MFRFFLSPESAPFDVASIQNQPARKGTDRLIQKGVRIEDAVQHAQHMTTCRTIIQDRLNRIKTAS